MDLRLLALLVCCAFMVEFGGQYVEGSVYVKGGSRYPFPRPQQSNTEAASVQKNPVSSSNKQPPARAYYIDGNRVQRDVLNSGIMTAATAGTVASVASIPSPAVPSLAAVGNHQKQQQHTQAVFEDQRPIDFDLNVRPMAQFIPGLKSTIN